MVAVGLWIWSTKSQILKIDPLHSAYINAVLITLGVAFAVFGLFAFWYLKFHLGRETVQGLLLQKRTLLDEHARSLREQKAKLEAAGQAALVALQIKLDLSTSALAGRDSDLAAARDALASFETTVRLERQAAADKLRTLETREAQAASKLAEAERLSAELSAAKSALETAQAEVEARIADAVARAKAEQDATSTKELQVLQAQIAELQRLKTTYERSLAELRRLRESETKFAEQAQEFSDLRNALVALISKLEQFTEVPRDKSFDQRDKTLREMLFYIQDRCKALDNVGLREYRKGAASQRAVADQAAARAKDARSAATSAEQARVKAEAEVDAARKAVEKAQKALDVVPRAKILAGKIGVELAEPVNNRLEALLSFLKEAGLVFDRTKLRWNGPEETRKLCGQALLAHGDLGRRAIDELLTSLQRRVMALDEKDPAHDKLTRDLESVACFVAAANATYSHQKVT